MIDPREQVEHAERMARSRLARDNLRAELADAIAKLLEEQRVFGREHLFSGGSQNSGKNGWLCCIAQLQPLVLALVLGKAEPK